MSNGIAALRRQMNNAGDLHTVVRAMKAVAASSVGQYEKAVRSLIDYERTVELALGVCLRHPSSLTLASEAPEPKEPPVFDIVIFGSDQGLVGDFNDAIADFALKSLGTLGVKTRIWIVGERLREHLADRGLVIKGTFPLPTSVRAITPFIAAILENEMKGLHLFYHRPSLKASNAAYAPFHQRLLPLDRLWEQNIAKLSWPTKTLPEIIGGASTFGPLIREYIFISLFRACADSLASENASRLEAMQRAEKNISELLVDLGAKFHRLRQSSIDEELFDVVSGFEALNTNS